MLVHILSWDLHRRGLSQNRSYHRIAWDESFYGPPIHSKADSTWEGLYQERKCSYSLLVYQERYDDTETHSLLIKLLMESIDDSIDINERLCSSLVSLPWLCSRQDLSWHE